MPTDETKCSECATIQALNKQVKELEEKWTERLELHKRASQDKLMYTKEERIENFYYASVTASIVYDLGKLGTNPTTGK